MVTLQILVLSFLVRIQVAQLKRLSFEGRFSCFYGKRVVVIDHSRMYGIGLRCTHRAACRPHASAALHLLPYTSPKKFIWLPDSHFTLVEPIGWRYIARLTPALCCIGSTAKAVRIQVAQLKREKSFGFSLFSWIFTFPPNLPLTKGGLFGSFRIL